MTRFQAIKSQLLKWKPVEIERWLKQHVWSSFLIDKKVFYMKNFFGHGYGFPWIIAMANPEVKSSNQLDSIRLARFQIESFNFLM